MGYLRLTGDAPADVAALRDWLAAGDPPPLLVETSGSTGVPKRVVLPREAVVASARASAERLGGEGPWSLALPSAYVAGVQVVVRSLLAGHEPILGAGSVADAVARGARFTSLVPTQLHRLLEDPAESAALASLHTVLLGGGPIDPALRSRARVAGVPVVATYGASETAGGCVYDGLPLTGVLVDVELEGRIRIGGPTLFSGYDGDQSLTRETLVDGWFLTPDAGSLDDDGRLTVLGRLDDVVVSGGVKVPAPAVRARLLRHEAVAAAEVLGVPDREWGQRVVAFVVGPLTLLEARGWVAAAHPRTWAPRQVVRLDALPLLANGKVDREALRRLA